MFRTENLTLDEKFRAEYFQTCPRRREPFRKISVYRSESGKHERRVLGRVVSAAGHGDLDFYTRTFPCTAGPLSFFLSFFVFHPTRSILFITVIGRTPVIHARRDEISYDNGRPPRLTGEIGAMGSSTRHVHRGSSGVRVLRPEVHGRRGLNGAAVINYGRARAVRPLRHDGVGREDERPRRTRRQRAV